MDAQDINGTRCSQRNAIVRAAAKKLKAQQKKQPKEKVDYDLMKKPILAGVQKTKRQRLITEWVMRDTLDLNVKIE